MKDVVTTSAVFFNYALLAVFAQNAVFTRALGVSRLVQLVGDDRTSSWLFGMQLCITQILVTPFAWYAGSRIAPLANRVQLRPLVYIASIAVVCLLEHAVLWLAKGLPHRSALLRIVPLAGLNSCVLGTVLVERTQSFTLGQSLGFGLGSGLGYVLAVLLHSSFRPGHFFMKISPWNLKNSTHTYPGGSAVKRITTAWGEKNRIHMKRGS